MKHFKQFLLAVLGALMSSVPANAYDFEADGIYYNVISSQDLTCEVTYKDYSYHSYSGDVVIPSSVTYSGKTYAVTMIGGSAFYTCEGLTSVVIPNSVTSIGNYSFYNCTCLTSVEIPNSVTTIDPYSFCNCI